MKTHQRCKEESMEKKNVLKRVGLLGIYRRASTMKVASLYPKQNAFVKKDKITSLLITTSNYHRTSSFKKLLSFKKIKKIF